MLVRRVKHYLVVPPQPLEEVAGVLALDRLDFCLAQDLGNGPPSVDGFEQSFLPGVDGKIQVRIGMALIEEHCGGPGWKSFFNDECSGQPQWDIGAPAVVIEPDWLADPGPAGAVRDQAVADHGSPEQLDRGVLLVGG